MYKDEKDYTQNLTHLYISRYQTGWNDEMVIKLLKFTSLCYILDKNSHSLFKTFCEEGQNRHIFKQLHEREQERKFQPSKSTVSPINAHLNIYILA